MPLGLVNRPFLLARPPFCEILDPPQRYSKMFPAFYYKFAKFGLFGFFFLSGLAFFFGEHLATLVKLRISLARQHKQ